ncbi:natural killer cells antigen CD94-like [Cyprinodon tularosa]|uniref:natural killer cells antigen CD94-like n=1 Tax=Cyprinodon tularosa TaxID=77115 RepID=UPI0018E27316|nr:natural killer cells antigen CD94-like [Cyprinodon tularosa]
MKPEEEIYVNLEELNLSKLKYEENGDKPGKTDFSPEKETRTLCFKAAFFLGLLSFLLLAVVVTVSVLYQRDFNQLSGELANQTAERNYLQMMNQNLTYEKDQLEVSLKVAELNLEQMKKESVTCPVGWRKFGCRCYLLSSWKNTWEQSKYQCSRNGADLVIIKSTEEMMFLKELGDQLKFWIGLQYTTPEKGWKWVDGSSLRNS